MVSLGFRDLVGVWGWLNVPESSQHMFRYCKKEKVL